MRTKKEIQEKIDYLNDTIKQVEKNKETCNFKSDILKKQYFNDCDSLIKDSQLLLDLLNWVLEDAKDD